MKQKVDIRPTEELHLWAQRITRALLVAVITWLSFAAFLWKGVHYMSGEGTVALGILIAFLVFSAVFGIFFAEEEKPVLIRGAMLESCHKVYRDLLRKVQHTKSKRHFLLSFLQVPWNGVFRHVLVCGDTGAGKSALIKLVINAFARLIKKVNSDVRALMLDVKRELYPYLRALGVPEDKLVIVDPGDERCYALDLATDVDDLDSANELGGSLVPPSEKTSEPYFELTAGEIVSNLVYSWVLTSQERELKGLPKIEWTMRDIVIASMFEEVMQDVLKKHFETRPTLDHFENKKVFRLVKSTLRLNMSRFVSVAKAWDETLRKDPTRKISIKQWAKEKNGRVILLPWDPTRRKALEPIYRVIIENACKELQDLVVLQSFCNFEKSVEG